MMRALLRVVRRSIALKLTLTLVGFVILLFVYFSFFLGPLSRSRNAMTANTRVHTSGSMSTTVPFGSSVAAALTRISILPKTSCAALAAARASAWVRRHSSCR